MTKKFHLFIILFIFAIVACNTGNKEEANKNVSDTTKVSVLTFLQQADSLIEKPVIIEGTVLHTCKHGGKRLFLVDGNDSIRVEVTAGPSITSFDESIVGSRIRISGLLKEERIDAKYLNDWENEVKKPAENHKVGVHTGAKGHEDQGLNEKLEQINALREELKNSGKDHLSNFSIEATKFVVIK
jgi:hypothetical protein